MSVVPVAFSSGKDSRVRHKFADLRRIRFAMAATCRLEHRTRHRTWGCKSPHLGAGRGGSGVFFEAALLGKQQPELGAGETSLGQKKKHEVGKTSTGIGMFFQAFCFSISSLLIMRRAPSKPSRSGNSWLPTRLPIRSRATGLIARGCPAKQGNRYHLIASVGTATQVQFWHLGRDRVTLRL